MSKGIYVKDKGSLRKIKNVWIKQNGKLIQKVIPKGKINNDIKEFINYYTPQIFATTGLPADGNSRLLKFDENLNKIFSVVIGEKNKDRGMDSWFFINDDEQTISGMNAHISYVQKRNTSDGSLVKEKEVAYIPTNPDSQAYRYENIIFRDNGECNTNFLYASNLETCEPYCPAYKNNSDGYVTGIIADDKYVFLSIRNGFYSKIIKLSHSSNGMSCIRSEMYQYVSLYIFLKIGNKIYAIAKILDKNQNIKKEVLQIFQDDFTLLKETDLYDYSQSGTMSAIYNTKNQNIYVYRSGINQLFRLDTNGNIIRIKQNILAEGDYNGFSKLLDADENGNLYFQQSHPKTGISIIATDENGNIKKSNLGILDPNYYIERSINITASRYKCRFIR